MVLHGRDRRLVLLGWTHRSADRGLDWGGPVSDYLGVTHRSADRGLDWGGPVSDYLGVCVGMAGRDGPGDIYR